MLNNLIKKKLIYFNLFIIIFLFFISFFFKPNLNLTVKYRFNNIVVNDKLNIFNEILNESIISDTELLKKLHYKGLEKIVSNYFQYIVDENNERVYKNCPTEITETYFKDVRIYKVDRFDEKFSVEIQYNSLLSSAEDEIKKCFEVIFYEQFNIYYLENLEKIKRYISDLVALNRHSVENKNNKDSFSDKIMAKRINTLEYLDGIKYLVSFKSEIKPVIIKNSVSYIIFYLATILFFFIVQMIYIINKIFKKKVK